MGLGAALVSRCTSWRLVFIQHMGRPVIKKVCAKQGSSHQLNSSTRGVDGVFFSCVFSSSLHHVSHIPNSPSLGLSSKHAKSVLRWNFTCSRNARHDDKDSSLGAGSRRLAVHMCEKSQVFGDFWSTLLVPLQTPAPIRWIYTSKNVMLVVYLNRAQPHLWFFSPCLQSYSLVRKTSNLHLTILFNQCWNLSI